MPTINIPRRIELLVTSRDDTSRGLDSVNRRLAATASAASLVSRAVGGISLGLLVRQLQQYADSWTQASNRLKVAIGDARVAAGVQEQILAIANRTRSDFETQVQLYARLSISARQLGIDQAELLRFTEGVGQALAASGTSSTQAAGALLQLGQALGSGIVRAEEFNSVLEGAPRIAQAVADGLDAAGGSIGRLRQLLLDGKLTSQDFFQAFMSQLPRLNEEFARTEATISQAFTVLGNSTLGLVGRLDDATDASKRTAEAILGIAGAIDSLAGKTGPLVDALKVISVLPNPLNRTATNDIFRNFANLAGVLTPPAPGGATVPSPLGTPPPLADPAATKKAAAEAKRAAELYARSLDSIRDAAQRAAEQTALIKIPELDRPRAQAAIELATAIRAVEEAELSAVEAAKGSQAALVRAHDEASKAIVALTLRYQAQLVAADRDAAERRMAIEKERAAAIVDASVLALPQADARERAAAILGARRDFDERALLIGSDPAGQALNQRALNETIKAIVTAKQETLDLTRVLEESAGQALAAFGAGIASAFTSMITGTQSAADAFRSMADQILKSLADIAVQLAVTTALKSVGLTIGAGGLASGGIVTKPTLTWIGEGGEPEAVIPLSKARQYGFEGGGPIYVTTNIAISRTGDVSSSQSRTGEDQNRMGNELARVLNARIIAILRDEKRPGGLLSEPLNR